MAAFVNTHPKDSLVGSLSVTSSESRICRMWGWKASSPFCSHRFLELSLCFGGLAVSFCYCRHECLLAFSLLKSTTQTLFVQHNAEETCLCATLSSVFHDGTSTPQGTIKTTAFEVALAARSYQQPTTDGWRLTGACSLYFWLIVKWSFRRPYTFLF